MPLVTMGRSSGGAGELRKQNNTTTLLGLACNTVDSLHCSTSAHIVYVYYIYVLHIAVCIYILYYINIL